MVSEGGRDFMTPFLPIGFKPEADVLADAKKKALPKYMPLFEKVIILFKIISLWF